jgi:hypothetical protein
MDVIAQFREIPPLSQVLAWLGLVLLFTSGLTLLIFWFTRRKR